MARLTVKGVEAALRKYNGNLAAVARACGVSRAAVGKFVKQRPALAAVVQECRESFVDNVESALYRDAMNGNTSACIFILKTLGRNRGYVERQEVRELGDDVDVTKLTDEELDAIINA